MTANEKHEDPGAELARSRRRIEEAKEAAAKVELADGRPGEAPETDPPHQRGPAPS